MEVNTETAFRQAVENPPGFKGVACAKRDVQELGRPGVLHVNGRVNNEKEGYPMVRRESDQLIVLGGRDSKARDGRRTRR
jgi:hypothetical protein